MKQKVLKRKLIGQLASISLTHFQVLKEAIDEMYEMRKPELLARDAVHESARIKNIKLKVEVLGDIEIVVHAPEKKKPSLPDGVRQSKFFLVASGDVSLVGRKTKALSMKRAGANILAYDELSDELKVKADLLLS